MSHSKMFEVAETAKFQKLAAKLAKKHEEQKKSKKTQNDHLNQEIAELQEKLKKQAAFVAAYQEERRAEYEKNPTDPRNVEWKKRQDEKERLAKSRWARIQKNLKEAGIVLSSMTGALLKSILGLIILLITLPFAILECVVRTLCCCAF